MCVLRASWGLEKCLNFGAGVLGRYDVLKKRKDYASQVQLRALRKDPLTSELARGSLRRFTGPA
eukprot:1160030-Pelagomonas_calceolata.AAC.5